MAIGKDGYVDLDDLRERMINHGDVDGRAAVVLSAQEVAEIINELNMLRRNEERFDDLLTDVYDRGVLDERTSYKPRDFDRIGSEGHFK